MTIADLANKYMWTPAARQMIAVSHFLFLPLTISHCLPIPLFSPLFFSPSLASLILSYAPHHSLMRFDHAKVCVQTILGMEMEDVCIIVHFIPLFVLIYYFIYIYLSFIFFLFFSYLLLMSFVGFCIVLFVLHQNSWFRHQLSRGIFTTFLCSSLFLLSFIHIYISYIFVY